MKLYVMLGQQLADLDRRLLVGKHVVSLGDAAETDHGVAPELGMVGGKKTLVGVGNDCLGDADFAVIEIEQGAIVMNAADADNAEVHLELIDDCLLYTSPSPRD